MNDHKAFPRRAILSVAAILPLVASVPLAFAEPVGGRRSGGKILVAYFSRTGNTRVVARQIQRAHDADLFEILPANPYPEDYDQTVAQSQRERDSNFEPALLATVTNIAKYDTVFLGFPVWSQTAPPVIRSFLSAHNLSGKSLVPFITHGGYGVGNSLAIVAKHAPRAEVANKVFSMRADQERQTLERVTKWLRNM